MGPILELLRVFAPATCTIGLFAISWRYVYMSDTSNEDIAIANAWIGDSGN